MNEPPRRDDVRWVVAAIILVVAFVAAVAVILSARHVSQLQADRAARAAAADAVPPVSESLRTALEGATAGTAVAARHVAFDEWRSADISGRSAIEARDTGRPILDDSGEGVIVLATYDTGAPPATVSQRRRHVADLRIIPLRLGSVLSPLRPAHGGISVAGPDRPVFEAPGEAPPSAHTYSVTLAPGLAPDWSITVWTRSRGIPTGAWLAALAVVGLAFLAAAWIMRRGEETNRNRQDLARLQERGERLAALAAVSQQSLDLADVLPAVTTELTVALGLRGLALSTPSAEGERLFFAWGESAANAVAPVVMPTELRAGEALAMVLSRAGRSVARLTVVAGRDLDSTDLTTLRAAADLLTSAVANAEAFAQQRDVLQRMRSLDELKTVFLATASHELRTPVGAITGFARMLSSNWDSLTPEQGRMYADRVDRNAERLGMLVEDLLDFARMEQGLGSDAGASVVDLGDVVSRILEEQPHMAADHELLLRTTRGLTVAGSNQAIERVVSNLVGNAAKYSPAGSTIRVSVNENHGRAELSVEDEGPGVPPSEREQIFSRFFRGQGDAVINTRGAGLGLAIVSEFAASMNGKVSVTRAESGGARFVVSYPLAAPARATSEGDLDVRS